ncbi:MAG TPA: xanthine dehydrogenase family protein molybdopterin-binding subunit [Myxococcota bacterium]|nr:xanthine dehydrogenase family protein molybdopterin-binding subunit [Myxococcota bacterium]
MSERKFRQVGTRPIRHDGLDKVTGRAQFGADFSLPGMLWGKVLRSPHAHARIRRIDVSAALALPGVHAVISGRDFPEVAAESAAGGEGATDFRDLALNVMARDKALYNGHAVAAVAATSARIAEEACRRIAVDYEVLTPVLSLDQALAKDAPILHEGMRASGDEPLPEGPTNLASRREMGRGDVAAGFAAADAVAEREFRTPMVHQGYIEPHAVLARTGEDGRSLVYCCTQGPFMVRAYSAKVLGVATDTIKVVPTEIGGGFGGKTTVYLEPLAILLSRKAGRPVKMVMTREEVFRATGPTSGTHIRVKMGAKRDGTLTAAEAVLVYEAGAFKGSPVGAAMMTVFAPYKLANVRIEGWDVVVNKPKVAAYRAPGAPMAALATEAVMDELARKLGQDPIDFRLVNAAHEGVQATYGPKYRAIGFVESLKAAKAHPHYRAPLGPNQGRGVACGFWFNAGLSSSANVSINEDGSAVVMSGCPDIGGSRASLALMAAEELGIPVEQVRPVVVDTESIGYNDLTGGSRVTFATGMAVIEAARDVVNQLRARAAKTWEVELDAVAWSDGRAVPVNGAEGKHEPLSLRQLAARSAATGGPIAGRASLTARGAGPGFATHVCDVEVDRETGAVKVLRYTAVQDAGRAIHPSYVEGQMQGGVAQGIGWALNEEYVFDSKGAMENAGFLDYRVPVASDLPMIDTVIVEVPNPTHPYGVRGVGETPIVPPLAAVANAVQRAAGVEICELPISPPKLLELIEGAR